MCRNAPELFLLLTNERQVDDTVFQIYIRICLLRISVGSDGWHSYFFLYKYADPNKFWFSSGISLTAKFIYSKKNTKNLQHIKSLRLKTDCKQQAQTVEFWIWFQYLKSRIMKAEELNLSSIKY